MIAFYLRSIICFAIITALMSCNANEFTSDKDKDEDKSSTRDNSAGTKADEPVMVGGAYLACTEISASLSASTEIGCALNNPVTGEKYDLSTYKKEWVVENNGSTVSTDSEDGSASDPYHHKITFTDNQYKNYSLRLALTNAQGQRALPYEKDLNRLDQDLRAKAPLKLSLTGLNASAAIAFDSSSANQGVQNQSCSSPFDCFVKGMQLGYVISKYDDALCRNGTPDAGAISARFGSSALKAVYANPYQDFAGTTVNKRCIINAPDLSVKESGGCIAVPIANEKNEINIFLINTILTKTTMAQVLELANVYNCQKRR